MLQRFCICLGLLIISFHANVSAANNVAPPVKPLGELVSPVLLEHCGLGVQWHKSLFLKADEKIDKMIIHGKYLLFFTDHNYLYCLDRHNSKPLFSLILARRGLPICGPSFYENLMMLMVGDELKTIDMNMGQIIETKDCYFLDGSALFSPVRNTDHFYVSSLDKRLYAYDVKKNIVTFSAASNDDSVINSVIADDQYLVFSTAGGDIVRILTDETIKKWRFQVDGVAASIVRDGEWIYVSSLDRRLYKLNIDKGHNGWLSSVLLGESLKDSARIGAKVAYQYAGVKGLFAIDKESGKKLWQSKGSIDLLSENGNKAYTLAKPSRLVVMDNAKGEKLYSVNFAGVSLHAANTEDSNIYVACKKGRVMCIKTK
jgi:outer membrane protein assembly factor BamB